MDCMLIDILMQRSASRSAPQSVHTLLLRKGYRKRHGMQMNRINIILW